MTEYRRLIHRQDHALAESISLVSGRPRYGGPRELVEAEQANLYIRIRKQARTGKLKRLNPQQEMENISLERKISNKETVIERW